ncbi:SPOR domain-containing protein [Salinispirillum marinum]|uniref:SPOR domain-containing protein n=2 Tax=Saccharospirillaceae TaxID=255527 RepID=A0ABV8BHQ5_9GAMM
MRWIVISLLGLNLAVGVWFGFVAEPSDSPGQAEVADLRFGSIVLAEPSSAANSVTEVNSADGVAMRAEVSEAALSDPSRDSRRDTPPQCAFIGRFANAGEAETARIRLSGLEVAVEVLSSEVPIEPLWWVYIPPFINAASAERELRLLNQRNIESFLVSSGEYRNALSLGYFRSRDNAVGLHERLSADIPAVTVREIERTTSVWWLRAQPESASLISAATLRTVTGSAGNLTLQRMDCSWLQNS